MFRLPFQLTASDKLPCDPFNKACQISTARDRFLRPRDLSGPLRAISHAIPLRYEHSWFAFELQQCEDTLSG